MASQLKALTQKVDQMAFSHTSSESPGSSINSVGSVGGSSSGHACDICGLGGHSTQECQLNAVCSQSEHVNAFQAQPRQHNPF